MITEQSKKYGTMIPTFFKREYQIGDVVSQYNKFYKEHKHFLLLDHDIETAKKYGHYRVPFKALDLTNLQLVTLFLNYRIIPLLPHV